MLFEKSLCNLLIAKFKMNRLANKNTNIHLVNTSISKSLLITFYIVK